MPITPGSSSQLGSSTLSATGGTALSGTAALTDTCNVLQNQGAADGIGGFLDNWVVIGTYPCSVEALTPSTERVEAERITAIGIYKFYLPATAVIDPGNRIRFSGHDFEVQDRAVPIANQANIMVRARFVE